MSNVWFILVSGRHLQTPLTTTKPEFSQSTQTFALTPEVMSYVLQQKDHTYIKYDVNHLANVFLHNSGDNCGEMEAVHNAKMRRVNAEWAT